jgi:raffinose/stachyose/melibiose transport system substrate-binding protein
MDRYLRFFYRAWVLILPLYCLIGPVHAMGNPEKVVLTMGSWRTDDIRPMNAILEVFHREYPHIRVIFDPVTASEYDEVLKAQLAGRTGPDLFYLRSFGVSRHLYENRFVAPLDHLKSLSDQFDPAMLAPWRSESGTVYGVPFIAVSHGIYYNTDIFQQLNLPIPQTWEQFLGLCRVLKQQGYIPLANASGDPWTINEIVFFNLAPNFIGGRAGRMAYLNGDRCFNDRHMVSALTAVRDLAPFLPENQSLLRYMDSLQLFVQGRAVMWMGGSWDIPYFNDEPPGFGWDVFAVPPPAGHPPFVTFHLDAGIGINADTPHKKAAQVLLEWIIQPAFGRLLGDHLPGFFPMHRNAPELTDRTANKFLSFNQTRETDIRLAWETLRAGSPDGYTLMMDAAVSVLNGIQTPRAAADKIQKGLEQWFDPAQKCRQ